MRAHWFPEPAIISPFAPINWVLNPAQIKVYQYLTSTEQRTGCKTLITMFHQSKYHCFFELQIVSTTMWPDALNLQWHPDNHSIGKSHYNNFASQTTNHLYLDFRQKLLVKANKMNVLISSINIWKLHTGKQNDSRQKSCFWHFPVSLFHHYYLRAWNTVGDIKHLFTT